MTFIVARYAAKDKKQRFYRFGFILYFFFPPFVYFHRLVSSQSHSSCCLLLILFLNSWFILSKSWSKSGPRGCSGGPVGCCRCIHSYDRLQPSGNPSETIAATTAGFCSLLSSSITIFITPLLPPDGISSTESKYIVGTYNFVFIYIICKIVYVLTVLFT